MTREDIMDTVVVVSAETPNGSKLTFNGRFVGRLLDYPILVAGPYRLEYSWAAAERIAAKGKTNVGRMV